MEKEFNKASVIATTYSWGGCKQLYIGPVMIEVLAGTITDNKYKIACILKMDDVKKELFSYSFGLSNDEYDFADARFTVEEILQSVDLHSIVANRVIHDVCLYFIVQSELPISYLNEFEDEKYFALWRENTLDLIHKRMAGEPLAQ